MVNKFTIEQVSMHNHREDLWIIVHGNVYDLTSFLMEHPGGEEVLLALAGQDGTECFDTIGHSDEAKQLREKFKIGEVANERGATQSQITSAGTTSADEITDVTEPDDQNVEEQKKKVLPQVFIYVTIAVYAIIFYYYYQNM